MAVDRAVVLAGGWAHPADQVAGSLRQLLEQRYGVVDLVTDSSAVAAALETPPDLLVVAACWFSMSDDRYSDEQRAEFAVAPDEALRAAIAGALATSTPLLALHTAVLCFDGWSDWSRWLGATWNWATSFHPPPGPVEVLPDSRSPIALGPFEVIDEEYQGLDLSPTVTTVARSGAGNPLAWLHATPDARVAVDLLGHDHRSLDDQHHRALLAGLIDWLMNDTGERV